MHCGSCSLVTSSGHLTAGGRGEEIDSAECVIRMNDAPSGRGFGPDVGRRTTLRVIAHSSMQRVLRSRHELLNSSHDTVFIFWGPSNYMRRDGKGLIYNNLRLMNQVLPKLKVYIISWQKMLQFDELFKKETGKDRYGSGSVLLQLKCAKPLSERFESDPSIRASYTLLACKMSGNVLDIYLSSTSSTPVIITNTFI